MGGSGNVKGMSEVQRPSASEPSMPIGSSVQSMCCRLSDTELDTSKPLSFSQCRLLASACALQVGAVALA